MGVSDCRYPVSVLQASQRIPANFLEDNRNLTRTQFAKQLKRKTYKHFHYEQHKEKYKEYKRKYRKNNKEKISLYNKEYRKKYYLRNKEKYKEFIRKFRQTEKGKLSLRNMDIARRSKEKKGGKLTIKTIRLVYEDNIKKYGTLTCEYCKNPIEFGKDTLEHKMPLSRGGTNNYENLCIVCRHCNSSKQSKTVEEFMQWRIKNYDCSPAGVVRSSFHLQGLFLFEKGGEIDD